MGALIVAGIDPGKKGGLVSVDEDGILWNIERVPVLKEKGKKEAPNYPALSAAWLPVLAAADHVFIELVGSMPKQGVASSFNFGRVYGFAHGLIVALKKPHTFITPQKWKKAVGISGSEGATSIRRACEIFPSNAQDFKRVTVDEGVAEAALIGYAGHQILKGQ